MKEVSVNLDNGEFKMGSIIKLDATLPLLFLDTVESCDKQEGVAVWARKALLTKRAKFLAYTTNFGTVLEDQIGDIYDVDVKELLIENEIRDALMIHPEITNVRDFMFAPDRTGSSVNIEFYIDTIFGVAQNASRMVI